MSLATIDPPELRLTSLIREIDENSSSAQLDRSIQHSKTIAAAAFKDGDEAALDDAHRSLFQLYARRIWNAPLSPLPIPVEEALRAVLTNLEHGFRGSLDEHRAGAVGQPPSQPVELAAWFNELATGPHPDEDPAWPSFVRDEISLAQLKQIVSHRSLFFLREPDPWIYAIPTLTGVAKAGLIDLLLDEYGWGKLEHMHSSVYARLMAALGLEAALDHHELSTPWQFLATQNHQWMLALTPGLSRQLLGTIYLTEAESPAAMSNYLAAWQRLGVTDTEILHFYELHVSADENHRDVALQEVLIPACADDPRAAMEIALGILDGKALEAHYANAMQGAFATA